MAEAVKYECGTAAEAQADRGNPCDIAFLTATGSLETTRPIDFNCPTNLLHLCVRFCVCVLACMCARTRVCVCMAETERHLSSFVMNLCDV